MYSELGRTRSWYRRPLAPLFQLVPPSRARSAGGQAPSDDATGSRYSVRPDLRSKLRVSVATGIAIATVLVIPDAISLLPNAISPLSITVRTFGLWLSVLVQWFLCFLGILSFFGFLNRGIIVDDEGIQLSRFSKRIAWKKIRAVSSDTRPFFSKLLRSKTPATRIHLFVDHKNGLAAKQIDSFLYSSEEFRDLLNLICRRSAGVVPDSTSVLVGDFSLVNEQLSKLYGGVGRKQKLMTVYVTIMLVLFLGRNSTRNFLYNEAGGLFNKQDYVAAKQYCELALKIDSTFPYAWDRLARAEYRLKELDSAQIHWNKALKMKPDLVPAKVGLSSICMQRRQYDEARAFLLTALRLEEANIPALINLIELNSRTGKTSEALKYSDLVVQLAPRNITVRLLAAQTCLRAGQFEKALDMVKQIEKTDNSANSNLLFKMVAGEIELARGDGAAAAEYLLPIPVSSAADPDMKVNLLLDRAKVFVALNRNEEALNEFRAAQSLRPDDKWIARR
ncbi:MAG: hypothetical protein K2Z81_08480, partial [Cyanobacteria bacterium]|nr:hypothetical protein [Cyanobacteriota bacterium]